MVAADKKKEIAKRLQASVNAMQGIAKLHDVPQNHGLHLFASAFPGQRFPTGAIHEFISQESPDAAATTAFIAALTGKLIDNDGLCLWIADQAKIFPGGITHFGIDPSRIIFIHAATWRDTLWILEESLKCGALTAVVGEINELGFTESRRLQLAAEQSGVTGFIHRHRPRSVNATATAARWSITPLPSLAPDDLPGIGHAQWDIQLLKSKNGTPHAWQVTWTNRRFIASNQAPAIQSPTQRQAV